MQTKLDQLKKLLAEIFDLYHVVSLLEWDQQTYMPKGGALDRANHLGTFRRLFHTKFSSAELGRLLEDLKPEIAQLDPDSDEARLVRVTDREYQHRTKIPADLIGELAQLVPVSHQAWEQAHAEDNYAKFQPYLERVVDIRRSMAACFAPYDHIYDPLLAEYEPGMKTADVLQIFHVLRPQQVELIKSITDRPQVNDAFLHQHFEEQKQWDFGVDVVSKFGYDWNRGRQDKTAHPFTTSFGLDDVRITTRFMPDYLSSALFSTMHESGHAMYEQGVSPLFSRTTLAEVYSLATHESQSRMWENLVGRSMPFWQYFYPRLQKIFSTQLGNVPLKDFYKGINKVELSFVRVESDEATYNLHIMLRLELEIALISGQLEVKDLPEAWNARMKEYLGIVPPNNSMGVLQDVHWAHGYFGYFSTYALGNLISAQLWECMNRDVPTLNDQIRRGDFSQLLSWLREKIHRHGSKFEAQEIVRHITGTGIDPAPYLRYLTAKYSDIYGV